MSSGKNYSYCGNIIPKTSDEFKHFFESRTNTRELIFSTSSRRENFYEEIPFEKKYKFQRMDLQIEYGTRFLRLCGLHRKQYETSNLIFGHPECIGSNVNQGHVYIAIGTKFRKIDNEGDVSAELYETIKGDWYYFTPGTKVFVPAGTPYTDNGTKRIFKEDTWVYI